LSIDLRNMLMGWCEEIVNQTKGLGSSFVDFEMEVIRTLAIAPPFDDDTYTTKNEDDLALALYQEAAKKYSEKTQGIADQAFPVFNKIRLEQGDKIENVVVPLTDGTSQFQITVPMQRALDSKCESMIRDFEKSVTLQTIDDEWKEHLRELDDLKDSTRNAQYEQKDPLLIYKIESFELYGQMLQRMNQKILGLLFRTRINDGDSVQEARQTSRKVNPKVVASKDEIGSSAASNNREAMEQSAPKQAQAPIINDMKVGRNDPCPCGSGKKFKQCHGRA